jgi:hypothetical protein
MFFWVLLPCLLLASFVGVSLHRNTFAIGDLIMVLVSMAIMAFTYLWSPWYHIKNSAGNVNIQLKQAGVDLSSPIALAKSIAVAGSTYTIATLADASGFGVFMASAKILGALGVSFTGIHLSMSALGFLLNPVVFTSISAGIGLVALATSIKSGDKLLGMSKHALLHKEWDQSYQFATQAFDKAVFKPTKSVIAEWYGSVDWHIHIRVIEVNRLETACSRITGNPNRFRLESYIIGWLVCIPIVSLFISIGINSISVAIFSLSIVLLVSERYQSVPMARLVTRLPLLQAELNILEKIRELGSRMYNYPDIQIADYKPPLTMDEFVGYCKFVVHYGILFMLACGLLVWVGSMFSH